jgi:hypothetical protein
MMPNRGNVAIVTNYADALHQDDEERRYYIAFSEATADELGGAEYFSRLWGWLDCGGAEVVRSWLMQRNLAAFNPAAAPKETEAQAVMREESYSPLARHMREQFLDVDQAISTFDLRMDMESFDGHLHRMDAIGRAFKELGWVKVENPASQKGDWQKRINGKKVRMHVWAHPDNQAAQIQAAKIVSGNASTSGFEVIDDGEYDGAPSDE